MAYGNLVVAYKPVDTELGWVHLSVTTSSNASDCAEVELYRIRGNTTYYFDLVELSSSDDG